jgi:hypothetical protein
LLFKGLTTKIIFKLPLDFDGKKSILSIVRYKGNCEGIMLKSCKKCQKEFETEDKKDKFCSWVCRVNDYEDRHSGNHNGSSQDAISDMGSNRVGYRLARGFGKFS